MSRDRTKAFARGLGNFEVMEISPTPASDWTKAGYIEKTQVVIGMESMQDLVDETGALVDSLPIGRRISYTTDLMQSSISEINLLRNAGSKIYAVRYYGPLVNGGFQYFCSERGVISPKLGLSFGAAKRILPLIYNAIKQGDLSYDVPLEYLFEGDAVMEINKVKLWIAPRLGLNSETNRILDISGFAGHGQLTSAYTSIWQQSTYPAEFLRLDGAVDSVSFGDSFDDDGTSDFMIECWVNIQGADDGQEVILSKKSAVDDDSAGFSLIRDVDNKITFTISSGSASASITSASDVLQDTWTHVAVAIDRNGNGRVYINGAADGSAVAVSSIGTGTNALNFYLGREGTSSSPEFGEVDIETVRVHTYGAGALPSDIATIIANHYSAERNAFNV